MVFQQKACMRENWGECKEVVEQETIRCLIGSNVSTIKVFKRR